MWIDPQSAIIGSWEGGGGEEKEKKKRAGDFWIGEIPFWSARFFSFSRQNEEKWFTERGKERKAVISRTFYKENISDKEKK